MPLNPKRVQAVFMQAAGHYNPAARVADPSGFSVRDYAAFRFLNSLSLRSEVRPRPSRRCSSLFPSQERTR
jgi:hypothetical protein